LDIYCHFWTIALRCILDYVRGVFLALLVSALAAGAVAAGSSAERASPRKGKPVRSDIAISKVVDVSNDETAQNETPIAVNPANPANIVVGANDWNPNDGCAVSATTDGGDTWSPTLPDGFIPGVTRFTNDPAVAGTGVHEFGGDPAVGFSPDGSIVYYSCLGFDNSPPFAGAVLVNRSTDGGFTWQQTGLSEASSFTGTGRARGSFGQTVDHDNLHVDPTNGYVYVTWAQFNGPSASSPVFVAVSHDEGQSWTVVKATEGNVISDENQRVVTDEDGNAYVVFSNEALGSGGTALYAAKSTDGGLSWSDPVKFADLTDPVCMEPPDCFNVAGGAFRAGGSYPAPAFDTTRDRLDVAVADIRGDFAQIYLYSLKPDLSLDFETQVTDCTGDCFEAELSAASGGRLDLSFYDRSYSKNKLVDLTYATSPDGGQNWLAARVTKKGFDPADWGVPVDGTAVPFIGDYNGIASTQTSALLAWTGVENPKPYNLEIDFATATPP
jgi:hypothetical protein